MHLFRRYKNAALLYICRYNNIETSSNQFNEAIIHYVFDVMDLLLHESEDSFRFFIVLALLDALLFLLSLHRSWFDVLALDLELAILRDAHLQADVLSSQISFLQFLL